MYKNSDGNMQRVLGTKVTLITDGTEVGTVTVADAIQMFLVTQNAHAFANLFDAIIAATTGEEVEYTYDNGDKSTMKKVANDSN